MKKVGILVVAFVAFAFMFIRAGQAQADTNLNDFKNFPPELAGIAFVKNVVLLTFPGNIKTIKDLKSYAEISNLLQEKKLKFQERISLDTIPGLDPRKAQVCGGIMERWILTDGSVLDVVNTLGGTISAIDQRYILAPETISRPVQNDDSWAVKQIEGTKLAKAYPRGKPVNVAVLDSMLSTPQFTPASNWDAFSLWLNPPPLTGGQHGTGVSSIIAAPASIGVAQNFVKLNHMRTCDPDGYCYDSTVVPAYCRAVHNGARVINMSFASFVQSPLLHGAIKDAQATSRKNKVLNVAAAGNSRSDDPEMKKFIDASAGAFTPTSPMYPAAWSLSIANILAVGAVDDSSSYAPFASVGGYINILAPGVKVPTFDHTGAAVNLSGTSFAAPYVTGAAAIMIANAPSMPTSSVTSRIKNCTTAVPATTSTDAQSSAGLLNINRMLTSTPPC
jgi:subtilisin family serine protease